MKNYPSISIVTTTLNSSLPIFERVLKTLESQSYPKNLIEHIVMDGGSINGTVGLARKYHCEASVHKDLMMKEQNRASLGIQKARGDLIVILQSDNIPTSKNWLREMVQPFIDNKKVFCTFSAYNSYEKDMSATTRYGAFFGAADPVLYFLKKSDKIPLAQKRYDKGEIIGETSGYWLAKFDKETLPTLGDNGTMFRRDIMSKVNKKPKLYVHPDAFVMMLDLGYNTCGVIKNSVIHIIPPNIFHYAKRRVWVKETFYDGWRGNRKYLVFNWRSNKDRLNLIKFIFFSLTFVIPLAESIRGYVKIRDKAWFLHPILCFLMLVSYGSSEIAWFIKKRYF
ncbi:MAG: hypothetical protein A3H17_01615 [Candidatus Levybacteria bacterium RIFCSPLOWO2_12_FULL_37_14]|nr:MAG: hypothetical protein A3H17_01615 [Candidatus Levybacteria bacterium RIFCSPLOWO2_12_FULL_37_14]